MNLSMNVVKKRYGMAVFLGLCWMGGGLPAQSSGGFATIQPRYYEAESIPAKYTEVEMDELASGRMYVRASKNDRYSPLAMVDLPQEMGRVTIWARIRGCSQELKTNLNGKAVDLKWKHQVPAKWTWVNFGPYERDALGDSIRFVRAPGGAGGLDAVFLDTTNAIDPRAVEDLKLYEAR
ncbi:hypothetical protein [Coraliomargarita parva]|uniref:hypothetical protein n=1 Tax=Coraliomargarita parva TaxID=3014050 RepID=UPI0022B4E2DF|nr:hypothetical protein [Coraliomargarita parva]